MRRLMTVEDTFMIAGRGLIVVPAPAIDECRGPADVTTELRRPDGTILPATLTIGHEFSSPPPTVRRWNCMFKALSKLDIPVGTEVWCGEDVFLATDGERKRSSNDSA
jgi:hypothetical protein